MIRPAIRMRQLEAELRGKSAGAPRITKHAPNVVIANWAPQRRWRLSAMPSTAPRASAG